MSKLSKKSQIQGTSLPASAGSNGGDPGTRQRDEPAARCRRRREVHTANMQTGRGVSSGKINATNVQSGALWRFSKPYMWDWRVGKIAHPTTELALAVGASSAFPPLLSPARLTLTDSDFVPATGFDLQKPAVHRKRVSDRCRRLRQPRPED